MRRLPATVLRAAAALVLLASCRGAGTSLDEIVLVIEAPLGRLDPRFSGTVWEARVARLLAPGLLGLAESGLGPTDGIAQSLVEEDPLTYVAHLRPDARFPDGRPVDATDVKYTFDSVRDPALSGPYRTHWAEMVRAVEAVDPRTVRFRLHAPRASFRHDVQALGVVDARRARVLDEPVREAYRAGRPAPPWDPLSEPPGAGPYRLSSRGTDWVVLERNPHARQPPATPRLVVRTIRDGNARVLALMGGSADLIENGVSPLVIETLERHPRLQVIHGRSATVTYLGFNLEDPILRDRRVRQAIALALDRERLVSAKLRGRAVPARSFLDRENPFFAAGRVWRHDPAAARRLLDEAGHRDPDGPGPAPRFQLTWRTTSLRDRIALAQLMARMLGEVGIAVEVRPFEFATVLEDVRRGNFQLFSLQLSDVIEPDILRPVFHSRRIPHADNGWAGLNRFRYRNLDVDRWLEEGGAASAPDLRRAFYARVQEALAEDLPAFPLWHEDNVIVARRALRGVRILKTGRLEGLLAVTKGDEKGH